MTATKDALRDALTSEGRNLKGLGHMNTVSKVCRRCNIEKPVTEFYQNKQAGYYLSECKECMKVRNKTALPIDPQTPRASTEILAIQYLHKNGIPTLPGKAMSYKHVDLVSFGCVLIEVKYSTLNYSRGVNLFAFHTTPSQQHKGFSAELVLLICDYASTMTFHIFESTHPVFYMSGRLKTGLTFTPGSLEAKKHGNNRVVMTQPLMDEAQDKVELVRQHLNSHIAKLVSEESECEKSLI